MKVLFTLHDIILVRCETVTVGVRVWENGVKLLYSSAGQPGSFAVQNRLLTGRTPWEFWYPGLEGVRSNQSMYIALNIGLPCLATYFLNLGLASTFCLQWRYNHFRAFNSYIFILFLNSGKYIFFILPFRSNSSEKKIQSIQFFLFVSWKL